MSSPVVLVYPSFDSNSRDPPIGLAYIAACLEREGIPLKVVDCNFISKEEAIKGIIDAKPRIVGFSVVSPHYDDAKMLTDLVRKRLPDSIIVWGGAHPSSGGDVPKNVDVVIRGEGEISFTKLVKDVLEGKDVSATHTLPPIRVEDLDSLPFPAWHHFPMVKYLRRSIVAYGYPTGVITGSRGCPFKCSFCASSKVFPGKVRFRSPSNIADEISWLIDEYHIRGIVFHDDTFNLNLNWATEVCDSIKDFRLKVYINCRVHPFPGDFASKLKEVGVIEIRFGVEHGSQRVLDEVYNKGIKIDQAKRAIATAKKHGIRAFAFFIFGAPTETEEDIEDTFKFCRETKPDLVQASILTPYPGTAISKMMKEVDTRYYFRVNEVIERFHREFNPRRTIWFRMKSCWRLLKAWRFSV